MLRSFHNPLASSIEKDAACRSPGVNWYHHSQILNGCQTVSGAAADLGLGSRETGPGIVAAWLIAAEAISTVAERLPCPIVIPRQHQQFLGD